MLRMKNTSIALRDFFILRKPPAGSQRAGGRVHGRDFQDTSGGRCLRAELPIHELRKCAGHPEPRGDASAVDAIPAAACAAAVAPPVYPGAAAQHITARVFNPVSFHADPLGGAPL